MDLTVNQESSPSAHLFTSVALLPRIHLYLPLPFFLLWTFSLHQAKHTSLQTLRTATCLLRQRCSGVKKSKPLWPKVPSTIHIIVLKSCLFICESALCMCALGLHPFIDQAQIRLIQKMYPYQKDVGRKKAGQIHSLVSGSNPCFRPCVLAHAVAMRRARPVLPTSLWRRE